MDLHLKDIWGDSWGYLGEFLGFVFAFAFTVLRGIAGSGIAMLDADGGATWSPLSV